MSNLKHQKHNQKRQTFKTPQLNSTLTSKNSIEMNIRHHESLPLHKVLCRSLQII